MTAMADDVVYIPQAEYQRLLHDRDMLLRRRSMICGSVRKHTARKRAALERNKSPDVAPQADRACAFKLPIDT